MTKQRSGFTLLETVLVLAIATLLFMSVTIGIGSRIASGRYETASNEIANFLRDVYADTLNTENAREGIEGARKYCTLSSATQGADPNIEPEELFIKYPGANYAGLDNTIEANLYPGRTNCAIYGKAIFFGVEGDDNIHAFDIVGNVVTAKKDENGVTDLDRLGKLGGVLEELKFIGADFLAALPENENNLGNSCRVAPAGNHTTYEPGWGTIPQTSNSGNGRDKGSEFIGMVMIVRSPLNGDVSTFFYERPSGSGKWDFIHNYIDNNSYTISCGPFGASSGGVSSIVTNYSPVLLMEEYKKDQELAEDSGTEDKYTGFCVGSDDFYIAISGRRKYVQFIGSGQNASAVKLNESDITNPDEEGYNPCR